VGNLGQLDGYPAGVSNSDPHFHDATTECHLCGATVRVDEECESCGADLDAELGGDIEPDEDSYRERER